MSKKVAHFSVFIWRISEKIKYGLIKAVLFFEKSLTGWISSAVLSLIKSGKNKRLKKQEKQSIRVLFTCTADSESEPES